MAVVPSFLSPGSMGHAPWLVSLGQAVPPGRQGAQCSWPLGGVGKRGWAEAAPGPHCEARNSPGSCPLLSSCSNLEAQRPHLSESCSIGKPACLQSSACAQSLSSDCSYAIVKDSLKVTEKQTSPVTSQ